LQFYLSKHSNNYCLQIWYHEMNGWQTCTTFNIVMLSKVSFLTTATLARRTFVRITKANYFTV